MKPKPERVFTDKEREEERAALNGLIFELRQRVAFMALSLRDSCGEKINRRVTPIPPSQPAKQRPVTLWGEP